MAVPTYRRATELMEAEVGDEIVALDAQNGQCFGFNSVAASIWRALAQPRTFEELKQALLDEYDVETERCSEDLRAMLREMSDKGLVER